MNNEKLASHENEKLSKYTYRDNENGGKIIFECIALDILEADKLYKQEAGKDPRKQAHVGCSIKDIVVEQY